MTRGWVWARANVCVWGMWVWVVGVGAWAIGRVENNFARLKIIFKIPVDIRIGASYVVVMVD